jgi:predicted transposase YdaD
MPEEPLHQPHDKFFRTAFSNPETAAAFLRAYLDRELVALVDWSSLHAEPGTFVDAHMKASTADLLFTAKVHGEDAHFYFLCEHQSSEDGLMALRVLAYMVRIWTEEARGQTAPPRLTPIIPVVVAQDNKVWKTSTKFHDLFKLPPEKWEEVRAYTPDFVFRLLQLVEHPFESLAGTADGKLALRVLKAQPVGELLGDPVWEATLLKEVSRELLETLIRYTHNEDVDKEQFWLRLRTLPRGDLHPDTMTLADKFREEGREEGLEQGRLEGAFRMLCDLLEVRFGGVPEGLREALLQIRSLSSMEQLFRHAIRCASLEEFAALL